MAVSALAQLLDQQPTAYAEVLAACRAMGWNASPTAQPADIIDELPSNVLPFIRRMLALLIYGDGSADSPAVVPATDRLYAQMLARQASPNYPAAGFPSDGVRPFLPDAPSIRDFAHLPQALSALSARKISDLGDVPDGISLARIMCSAYHPTELDDDNVGWAMTKTLPWSDLVKVLLGCSTMNNTRIMSFSSLTSLKMDELVTANYGSSTDLYTLNGIIYNLAACTEVSFNKLESVSVGGYGSFISALPLITKITFPALKEWKGTWSGGIVANMDGLEELYCPSLILAQGGGAGRENFACYCPKLWKVVVGYGAFTYDYSTYNFSGCPNLVHLEFEHEVTASQVLRGWSPTNALDASRTDLIEEGSTAQNNLDQFLQNFRSHIALRLTSNGSGKTLTLSQAVYDAIKDETHLFVFDEGTMTIYAYLTNIKHWTVTK